MTDRRGAILVTGGAGYVGSFTVRALAARGEDVVVLDDLSRGHRKAVPPGVPLVKARIQDRARVRRVLRSRPFDTILHFAAFAYVGESMEDPLLYWHNNVEGTLRLLEEAVAAGVEGLVFSSSCTVYGTPKGSRVPETTPRHPVSAYGRTKAACELMLEDLAAAGRLRSFRLRYFNAAGAAPDGSLGEDHDPETHLLPLALRAAMRGTSLTIHGTDWPTADGTCIRDYVHVEDLAQAHVAAVDRLRGGSPGGALNLGTGRGASVLEVVAAAEAVTGRRVRTSPGTRRAGDTAMAVAGPGQARAILGWKPRFGGIESIMATAWEWHRIHPLGFGR
jgi:UDP-glucose 4-epimerase